MVLGPEFQRVLPAAQGGDEQAFARLYRDLNPALTRYLDARAPGTGQDLAAETWLGAARRLPSFRGEEPAFRAWMFTIARRQLVQHWRDQRRRPSEPADPAGLGEQAGDLDPEGEVVSAMAAREAARAIASALTPDQADVVLLRLIAGLDVDQVADVLDKRPGTVRVLQHKAVRRLAKQLSMEAVTL